MSEPATRSVLVNLAIGVVAAVVGLAPVVLAWRSHWPQWPAFFGWTLLILIVAAVWLTQRRQRDRGVSGQVQSGDLSADGADRLDLVALDKALGAPPTDPNQGFGWLRAADLVGAHRSGRTGAGD
ncbi:MAG: hypothetical protein LBV30_02995 [Propionibacteriaceae bacterium]|jgi:hypothetical protein|nr:hypothetical protein [Propionibacteriaceae bacterium]